MKCLSIPVLLIEVILPFRLVAFYFWNLALCEKNNGGTAPFFENAGSRVCCGWRSCTPHGVWSHHCCRQCRFWSNWTKGRSHLTLFLDCLSLLQPSSRYYPMSIYLKCLDASSIWTFKSDILVVNNYLVGFLEETFSFVKEAQMMVPLHCHAFLLLSKVSFSIPSWEFWRAPTILVLESFFSRKRAILIMYSLKDEGVWSTYSWYHILGVLSMSGWKLWCWLWL